MHKPAIADSLVLAFAALAMGCHSTAPPDGRAPPPPLPHATDFTDAPSQDAGIGPRFVLLHLTVVDVEHGTEQPDRAVVIDEGRIVGVVAARDAPVTPRRQTVDARGKWVIPGLWDMHVHLIDPRWSELFIANGVTGVRVMWGNPRIAPGTGRIHYEMREAFDKGERVGPRMVIASNIMDGPLPIWPNSVALATPEEGRHAVDDAKKDGADFIKVYTLLPRDVFFAIADESKRQAIPFAGHVPDSVTIEEASDAGMKSMEHLLGLATACSTRERELLQRRARAAKTPKSRVEWAALKREETADAIASFDEAKAKAVFANLVRNGSWQTPTLTVLHAMRSPDEASHQRDPRMQYVSRFLKRQWDITRELGAEDRDRNDEVERRATFDGSLALVGAMNKAGVGILAGTDEANPYCFAGFGLHDELGWLVKAGLSPVEALRAATLSPARYLASQTAMGTIDEGKVADLVVLDADPLADIANTRQIWAVVARGVLYDRAKLDRMLADVKEAADASQTAQGSRVSCSIASGGCAPPLVCRFDEGNLCGASGAPGWCGSPVKGCVTHASEVCGCDGVTYESLCAAHANAVAAGSRGECIPCAPGATCADVVDGRGTRLAAFCHVELSQLSQPKVGFCWPRPSRCDAERRPVCGWDRRTYGSGCEARQSGTDVEHEGACAPRP